MSITLSDKELAKIAAAIVPHISPLIDARVEERRTTKRRLLRAKDVMELTGLTRSNLYRSPDFPKQIKIGERAVAWDEIEVRAWMDAKRQSRES